MFFSNYKEIFKFAKDHKVTIGAFNCCNMEMVQASVAAAEKMNVPLIMQTYPGDLEYAGAEYMVALCSTAASKSKMKLALGLDHGQSFEQAKHCIESGYSAVMIDLSSKDYQKNVDETCKVVELSRKNGVSVEAEIGEIVSGTDTVEKIASGYTDPVMAKKFVEDTGVDCLAVSIGTAHGLYTYEPKINFDLLKELIQVVPCPIVVHGGSNTPDDEVREMVRLGVSKINIGTDLFHAFNAGMQQGINECTLKCTTNSIMTIARKKVEEMALHKLKIFTSYRV